MKQCTQNYCAAALGSAIKMERLHQLNVFLNKSLLDCQFSLSIILHLSFYREVVYKHIRVLIKQSENASREFFFTLNILRKCHRSALFGIWRRKIKIIDKKSLKRAKQSESYYL